MVFKDVFIYQLFVKTGNENRKTCYFTIMNLLNYLCKLPRPGVKLRLQVTGHLRQMFGGGWGSFFPSFQVWKMWNAEFPPSKDILKIQESESLLIKYCK